ncbi:MAG: hypothetical protein JSS62_02220, partial [Verrucomicrobia bacterium]|nr:hypothetical protein [Verrucomicrobiota bacterium]
SEEFSDKMPKLDKKTSFIMCFKAVLFFPHHFEDILSVAQTFDPDIHLRRDELQAIQQQALKRFKIIYDDHLKFVLDQGITLQQATVVRPLNPDKVKRLEKVIADWLRLQHNDKYMTPDLLGSDPETAIAKFHQDFLPRFLVHLYVFFTRMLEENAQSYEGRASSMTELLRIRTLEFTKQHACYNTFIETVCAIPRDMLKLKYETSFLHYHLLDLILNELVKEGEIAYYNRELGYGGRTIHCIFC